VAPGFCTPELLAPGHQLADFDCPDEALTRWLRNMARESDQRGTARTYVTCPSDDPTRVVAYYSLSAASIACGAIPDEKSRRMPDPIPAVLLRRLAVSTDASERKLGGDLVFDGMRRSGHCCAWEMGAAFLVVQAKTDEVADRFYRPAGFWDTNRPNVLCLSLRHCRKTMDPVRAENVIRPRDLDERIEAAGTL
jgi:hypothetical protein